MFSNWLNYKNIFPLGGIAEAKLRHDITPNRGVAEIHEDYPSKV